MSLDKTLRRLAAGAKAFLTLICTVHAPASSSASSSAPASGHKSLSGRKSTPADLVEDRAHQRLGAADVGWRHDEVKRNRLIPLDQIVDAPVAVVGDLRDDGVAIEPQERHG
jgi:hypothetical protein